MDTYDKDKKRFRRSEAMWSSMLPDEESINLWTQDFGEVLGIDETWWF